MVGSPGSRTFRLVNDGNATLTVTSITSNSPRFTIPGPPTSVAVGASADFIILFTPTGPGTVTPTITINSNSVGSGNPYTFAIKGTGRAPDIVVAGAGPSYLQEIPNGDTTSQSADGTFLGEAALSGETQVRAFRIRNDGNRRLQLLGGTITGPHARDFTLEGFETTSVQEGEYLDFRIEFNPSVNGIREATVRIVSDDPFKPVYTFDVDGTGAVDPDNPSVVIEGAGQTILNGETRTSLTMGTDFGTRMAGAAPVKRTFQIENTSNQTLTVFAVFANHPACEITRVTNYTPAPFGTSDFDVTFTPLSGGPANAIVTVLNDDPRNASYTFAVAAITEGLPTPTTIEGLDLDADNGGGEITIIGAPGSSFRLAFSTTLEDGSWDAVPGYEDIGTTGSSQILSLTGLVDPEIIPRIFFRLEEN